MSREVLWSNRLNLAATILMVLGIIAMSMPKANAESFLLVANMGSNTVEKYTLTGSKVGTFANITAGTLTTGAFSIVQGGDGNVYVGNFTYGYVCKYTADGTSLNDPETGFWTTNMGGAYQLVWKDGKLWRCGFDNNTVAAYDPETGEQSGPIKSDWASTPSGLAFGPDGRAYVSQWLSTETAIRDVLAWDTTTGGLDIVVDGFLSNAGAITFDGDDMYVADVSQGRVIKYNPDAGASYFKTGLGGVGRTINMALPYNGKVYVSEENLNRISILDMTGRLTGLITGLNQPGHMCILNAVEPVATPMLTPAPGLYESSVTVAMTCATPGTTIRYTTDGSEPSQTNGTVYEAPISVSTNTRVRAIAFKSGETDSKIRSGTYVIGRQLLMLITNQYNGNVLKYTFDQTPLYVGVFCNPWGYGAYDALQAPDKTVFVANLGQTFIAKYSQDGVFIPSPDPNNPGKGDFLVSPAGGPSELSWKDGKLWSVAYTGFTAAYDPVIGEQMVFRMWDGPVSAMRLASDGRFYVCQWIPPILEPEASVIAWNADTDETEILYYPGANNAGGSWIDADGSLYTTDYNNARVVKWNPTEGVSDFIAGPPFTHVEGDDEHLVGVFIYNGRMYVTEQKTNKMFVFNMSDRSLVATVTEGLGGPAHMNIFEPPASAWNSTIAQIKNKANDEVVSCAGVAVTARFSGAFYVEDISRSNGIRVETTLALPEVGTMVNVSGAIKTNSSNGERYIEATKVTWAGNKSLEPLGLNNKALGGGDFAGQTGVTGAAGLNNIGLLVKAWGKVTSLGGSRYSLSDGAGVDVVFDLPTGHDPLVNDSFHAITGISSSESNGSGGVRRLILPRDANDID